MPGFLQRRHKSEEALAAVVQEAYVHGVSTRKVDDLVQAMGLDGMGKSAVSRICAQLDEEVRHFKERPISQPIRYMWLDATYVKVREHGSVVSMALVLAVRVCEDGYREVLGWETGHDEDEAFWIESLRKLAAKGVRGVRAVTSNAHEGLKKAISRVLTGAAWQRCRVHFMRNILAKVPRNAQHEFHTACPACSPALWTGLGDCNLSEISRNGKTYTESTPNLLQDACAMGFSLHARPSGIQGDSCSSGIDRPVAG